MNTLKYLKDVAPTQLYAGLENPRTDRVVRQNLQALTKADHQKLGEEFIKRYIAGSIHVGPFLSRFVPRQSRVLEVGSGHGAKATSLASFFDSYTGLEIVQGLVDHSRLAAKELDIGNVRFHLGEASDIAQILKSERFDVIILYAVLEHLTVSEKLHLLEVCWEHLDEGGFLYIGETPNRMFPIDYHSTKLAYFQQCPLSLWPSLMDQAKNRGWIEAMQEGLASDTFEKTAFRRGIPVGYQEFELGLKPLGQLSQHVIADGFTFEMLNLYPPNPLDFIKSLEFEYIRTIPDWAGVQSVDLPAFMSRYFIEVLLSKSPVTPTVSPMVEMIVPDPYNMKYQTGESGGGVLLFSGDIFEVKSSKAEAYAFEVAINFHTGRYAGTFRVKDSKGSVLVERNLRSLISCLGVKNKGNISFGMSDVSSSSFPLVIEVQGETPCLLSSVYLRPKLSADNNKLQAN